MDRIARLHAPGLPGLSLGRPLLELLSVLLVLLLMRQNRGHQQRPLEKLFTSRLLHRWQLSRQSCFEKLGTATGLPGAICLKIFEILRLREK